MARRSSSAPADSFPGFGDVAEIGEGRRSSVYRARELDTGRLLALKLVTLRDLPGSALEAFDREAAVVHGLSAHPNIVTFHGAFRMPDGRPVLVLDLCRGSIADHARERGLPVADAVSAGVKIAGALAAAHAAGLLHRDVTPRHVVLTDQGEPALADLGVGRLPLPGSGPLGVPVANGAVHAAPEVLDGRPATPASDVYGLASTLYELIAGTPAFRVNDGESTGALALRIRRDPPPPLSAQQVPPALSQLLADALAKEPEQRPASAADFAARLTQVHASLQSSLWGAPAAASADDDGWSTPSLVETAHALPRVSAPAAPADDGWSTPSLVTHAETPDEGRGPEDGPADEAAAGAAGAAGAGSDAAGAAGAGSDAAPPDAASGPDPDEPPLEMTRRRPLSSMSPAFGTLPVPADGTDLPGVADAAEQIEAQPLPDFPPPVIPEAAPAAPRPEVEPAAGETRQRPAEDELPPAIALDVPADRADGPPVEETRHRRPDLPPPVEETRRRPPEHTLPGPVDLPPAEPPAPSLPPVPPAAAGTEVPAAVPEAASDAPAAPSRAPEPDPDELAAAIWAADPEPVGTRAEPHDGPRDEAPAQPPVDDRVGAPAEAHPGPPAAQSEPPVAGPPPAGPPAVTDPPAQPPAPAQPPEPVPSAPPVPAPPPQPAPAVPSPEPPVVPPPAPSPAPEPSVVPPPSPPPSPPASPPQPATPAPASFPAPQRQAAAAEHWDPDALAAAIWPPGAGGPPGPGAGEESGRYPLTPESEVPTATGPVPTWAFGQAFGTQAPQAQPPAAAVGDLTLDPASLRRKVTIRSGGASMTIDETKLVLRQWLRKTEIAWPTVRGFEPRFGGSGSPGNGDGSAGSLVAITDSGPVELPATHRSMADLRYIHALLDAYRQRAQSEG